MDAVCFGPTSIVKRQTCVHKSGTHGHYDYTSTPLSLSLTT